MPRSSLPLFQSVCIAAFLSLLAVSARADKPAWAGGSNGTGNANNGNNWVNTSGSSGTPPGQGDTAVIDHGKATFDGSTLLGGIDLTGNATTNTTGAIDGSGTVTLLLSGASGSTWDAGTISFTSTGSAVVSSTASLTIQTSNAHVFSGGSIKNQGSTQWTGGSINAGNGASLLNDTGATFEATADGAFTFDQGGTLPTFENKGTLKKTGGSGGETNIGASVINTGTINASVGTLTFAGGGSSSGNVSVGNGAKLKITGTDFTFSGGAISGSTGQLEIADHTATFNGTSGDAELKVNGGNASFSGTHTGTGKLTLAAGAVNGSGSATFGSLNWSGGEIAAGNVSVSGATIGTGGTKRLTSGSNLNLGGTTHWTGDSFTADGNTTITNTGTFSADTDNTIAAGSGGQATFKNQGTFAKSQTSGTTEIQATFDNTGSVSVTKGELKLHGGGTSSGTLTASGTGTDILIDNSYTLASGASVSGTVRFTGGTLTASGNITANGLSIEGGSVQGTHTFKGGAVGWTGGNWNAGNATTTIDTTATLNISGTGNHDFNAHAFVNNGTTNWSGGALQSGNGGTFTNNGTFNDSASAEVNNAYGNSALVFTNASGAHYNKSAAGTTNYSIAFNNAGDVAVTNGTLSLNGGGALSTGASMSAAAGAHVVFNSSYSLADTAQLTGDGDYSLTNGTLTASGNIAVSNLKLTGGTLAGSHALSGKVNWTGGNLNGGGTTTITSSTTLTMDGTGEHDFNARALVNNGTANWSGGKLRSGNGGTFTNNGTFNDSASNDINNDYGNAALVFTNASGATYNKTGAGQTNFYVALDNSGTVNVGNGTLNLNGGGTLRGGGVLRAEAGTDVVFSNSYTLADASSLTGAGNFTVTNGTFNATGNVNVSNFTIAGGTVSGAQTFKGTLKWTGGNFNNGDATTVDAAGALTISGSGEHDFNGHQFTNNGTTNWTAGRLRSGNGGTLTNNGTFVDAASSEINNDYGNTSLVFTNANGAMYRKTVAGDTTFNVPLINNGVVEIQAGAIALNASSSFNNGSRMTGNGVLKQMNGVLSVNGVVSFDHLQIVGGSVDGSHTLAGQIEWSAGSFNNTGSTGINGTLTIDSAGDHDFNGHTFNNNGTVEWTTGAGRLRSGNGGQFQNNGTFNDSAASTWNNDYQNAQAQFTNGATGTYNKKTSGTTLFDGVSVVNAGTINVSAGSLEFRGGGSSPTGAHFNAETGAAVRFSGGTFAVADGAAFTGAGSYVIAGGKTTIGATVSAADVQLTGGTLGGSQTFSGGLSWTGGDMNDAGTTTIGGSGKLTIGSSGDHDFNAHALVNNGTVDWTGGRLRSGNGGSITNNGTFNDRASNAVNNDYQNTALTFTNGSGANYNKLSSGTTDFYVVFNNHGSVNVSTGLLVLHNGGSIGAGAGFYGNGATQLAAGSFNFAGAVSTDSLTLAGGTLTGSPVFHGLFKFVNGLLGSGATTTIASDGVMEISGSADHDLPGHTVVNNGVINWKGGRIRGGSGAIITNNGVFNDFASSDVNNDYQNATLTFTNASNGTYNKKGSGTTTFGVPFVNDGTLAITSGAMVFNGTFTNNGSLTFANGATAQFSSPLTFAHSRLGGTGTITAPSVTAGGVVSPGNSPGTLAITGDLTLLSTSTLLIELGGRTQGTTYDFLNVGGNVTLGGTLSLSFVNGFASSVLGSDTFTILTAGGTSGLSGAFANIGTGKRLATLDGLGSFQVNYGGGLNSVTLSNFQAIPEPSTYALMGLGTLTVVAALRRRKARNRS
jgi:hypothetical protein